MKILHRFSQLNFTKLLVAKIVLRSNQRVKSLESFLSRKSEHTKGSNAKLNFDGCPLLYWGCFLHNAISRIVLAWKIQSDLSITSNLPCARCQVNVLLDYQGHINVNGGHWRLNLIVIDFVILVTNILVQFTGNLGLQCMPLVLSHQ